MAITTNDKDGTRYIVLRDVVDIAQAAGLKRTLTETIGSVARACIQVSSATAIDVTTAQLLWAAVSCAPLSGTELVVEGPWSAQVEESFSNTGLSPALQLILENSHREESNVLARRQ